MGIVVQKKNSPTINVVIINGDVARRVAWAPSDVFSTTNGSAQHNQLQLVYRMTPSGCVGEERGSSC